MYENSIDILKKEIGGITLSDYLKKEYYESNFHYHLSDLWGFFLRRHENVKPIKITKDSYNELENYAIEEGDDKIEVNWDFVLDAREILEKHIRFKLGKEGQSETLRPFINSTVDTFESKLLFSYTHNTEANPWDYAHAILNKNGCLHLVTDNEEEIVYYNKDLLKKKEDSKTKNMSVIAASNRYVKKDKKNLFSGIIVEDRLTGQTKVYRYLSKVARGRNSAKSLLTILVDLKEQGHPMNETHLKTNILLPLKRQGVIGSNSQGYYYINDIHDLNEAFDFHLDKVTGIVRTLKNYVLRAELQGDLKLKEELIKYFNIQMEMKK